MKNCNVVVVDFTCQNMVISWDLNMKNCHWIGGENWIEDGDSMGIQYGQMMGCSD